jgi:DUF917 family protein
MKRLSPLDIKNLILGTTLLGTGGGGPPAEARAIYAHLQQTRSLPRLTALNQLNQKSICLTAFGVGPIEKSARIAALTRRSYQTLQKVIKQKVSGIIPVEIGPASVANAFYLAALLDLPIVDADFVGGRSSPEVFLETITLFDLPRTPLAVTDSQQRTLLITKNLSPLNLEGKLRAFAARAGGPAVVVGYPLPVRKLRRTVESGTVSEAIKIGQRLAKKQLVKIFSIRPGQVLFRGKICRLVSLPAAGFSAKKIILQSRQGQAKIFVKNENLLFWINGRLILTCPDLICLLNNRERPLYNAELRSGQSVTVIGLKARALWRTNRGQKLFRPKIFGFRTNPVLLPCTTLSAII